MTEREYVALANQVRIGAALELMRHVLPDATVDEAALKEVVRQLAVWQMDLFKVVTIGEAKGAADGE